MAEASADFNFACRRFAAILLVSIGLALTTLAEGLIRTGAWLVDHKIEEID